MLNEVYNMADALPKIDKALRIVALCDTRQNNAINFLADEARKDWRVNDSLQVANRVYGKLRTLGNPALARRFEKNFNAFCGVYGTQLDDSGNDQRCYMREANVFNFTGKGIIPVKKNYAELRAAALANSEILIARKIQFMQFAPAAPRENIDAAVKAGKQYENAMSIARNLRDNLFDWQDSEHSANIAQLLKALSAIDASLFTDDMLALLPAEE